MNQNGFVHRDIKQQNIGLDTTGTAKIFDFGFAVYIPNSQNCPKNQNKTPICQLTKQNVWGSDPFIDPNYNKNKILSINSDIYSLGVILLETYFKIQNVGNNIIVPYAQSKLINFMSNDPWKWDDAKYFQRSHFDNEIDQSNPSLLGNLVKKMIHQDPLWRYTSEEALRDPWFSSVRGGRKRKTRKSIKHRRKSRKTKK